MKLQDSLARLKDTAVFGIEKRQSLPLVFRLSASAPGQVTHLGK